MSHMQVFDQEDHHCGTSVFGISIPNVRCFPAGGSKPEDLTDTSRAQNLVEPGVDL